MAKFFEVRGTFGKSIVIKVPVFGSGDRRSGQYGGSEGEPFNIRTGGLTYVAGTDKLHTVTEKTQPSDFDDYENELKAEGVDEVIAFRVAAGRVRFNLSNFLRLMGLYQSNKKAYRLKEAGEYLKRADESLARYRNAGRRIGSKFRFVLDGAPYLELKEIKEADAADVLAGFTGFCGALEKRVVFEYVVDKAGRKWLEGMYGGEAL